MIIEIKNIIFNIFINYPDFKGFLLLKLYNFQV